MGTDARLRKVGMIVYDVYTLSTRLLYAHVCVTFPHPNLEISFREITKRGGGGRGGGG